MPFNGRQAMMRQNAGGSVGGILRKTSSVANVNTSALSNVAGANSTTSGATTALRQIDLLVFGYACKVFRDDDKAREIDQGKHLIPWMGDNSLKIDRYDVRGALYDLAPYEAPPGGYGNRTEYLSTDEQRAEQLCEEERYLFLHNNEDDHMLRQEEELKRLKQETHGSNYSQVNFQYGIDAIQHGPHDDNRSESPNNEQSEQPFILPKNVNIPPSIALPETMKQHAIIERTARFIAQQGIQMEILLKAKQSNNLQFEFLSQNSPLNNYYKFIIKAINDGEYPTVTTVPTATVTVPATNKTIIDDRNDVTKTVITVPTIKYKPSANCAYTQLISKIKGVPLPVVIDEATNATTTTTSSSINDTTNAGSTTTSADNFTPVLLQYNGNTFVNASNDENSNADGSVRGGTEVEILKNTSALALAQNYGSDTDTDNDDNDDETATAEPKEDQQPEAEAEPETVPEPEPEPILEFPIPDENLKNIIDKTAIYVIKNGRQFEETLRTKSESRFTFLIPDSEFYPYYMYKITGDPNAASKEQKTRKAAAVAAALISKKGLGTIEKISTVSFSIKSKDESIASNLPIALPQETSDDEDDDDDDDNDDDDENADIADKNAVEHPNGMNNKIIVIPPVIQQRNVPEHVQRAIQLVESQLMARNAHISGTTAAAPNSVNTDATTVLTPLHTLTATGTKNVKTDLDRNAIFEQQQQNRQKELKKAEEKVKDKLAQIAREKLGGLISREKQLQLERKRKAMAFLNQIKGDSPENENEIQTESTEVEPDGNVSEDSDESVHSIPITSYGPPEEKSDNDDDKIGTNEANVVLSLPQLPLPDSVAAKTKKKHHTIKTPTLSLSDDDDVQVIGESEPITKLQKHSLLYKKSRDLKTSTNKSNSSRTKRSSHSRKYDRNDEVDERDQRDDRDVDNDDDDDDDYDNEEQEKDLYIKMKHKSRSKHRDSSTNSSEHRPSANEHERQRSVAKKKKSKKHSSEKNHHHRHHHHHRSSSHKKKSKKRKRSKSRSAERTEHTEQRHFSKKSKRRNHTSYSTDFHDDDEDVDVKAVAIKYEKRSSSQQTKLSKHSKHSKQRSNSPSTNSIDSQEASQEEYRSSSHHKRHKKHKHERDEVDAKKSKHSRKKSHKRSSHTPTKTHTEEYKKHKKRKREHD